jgi:hypothetical protein
MDAIARCVLTPKAPQSFTSNAHQVLFLIAPPLGGRATAPMVLASILLNITRSFGLFPPACSHHTRVITHRLLVHYYDESARQRLITAIRSILTKHMVATHMNKHNS